MFYAAVVNKLDLWLWIDYGTIFLEGITLLIFNYSLSFDDFGNCAVLQSGTFLRNAFASFGGRILALVGSSSLGRRLFRGFRNRHHCVSFCQTRRDSRRKCSPGIATFGGNLFERRHYRHTSSPLFCRNSDRRNCLRFSF